MNGGGATARGSSKAHERLFHQREFGAIRGKGYRVTAPLFAMVFATLLTFVLAKSAMNHLERSMADPFTSQLRTTVTNASGWGNYERTRAFMDSCARVGHYNATRASGVYAEIWDFHTGRPSESADYARVVSFSFFGDKELLKRILAKDNLVSDLSGVTEVSDPDLFKNGVIISREFMDALGCAEERLRSGPILMDHGNYTVPLRVLAVTHVLPFGARCLVEHSLALDVRRSIGSENSSNLFPFRTYSSAGIWLKPLADDPPDLKFVKEELEALLNEKIVLTEAKARTASHPIKLEMRSASDRMFRTEDKLSLSGRLKEPSSPLRDLHPALEFEVNWRGPDSTRVFGNRPDEFDELTVGFSATDEVDAFAKALWEYTNTGVEGTKPIELDLAGVKSKQNFGTVASLVRVLQATLLLFAMLAIILYLHDLLRNHLVRMKMNLGTFMAFGMAPGFIKKGYQRIILLLLARVVGVALISVLLLQVIIWLVLRTGVRLPAALQGVSVLSDPWLYVCLMAIFGSSMLICHRQLSRFLASPPGDLIYDRK